MYHLWYMAQRSAAMDAAGMTWMAGSACARRATAGRRIRISIDFSVKRENKRAYITPQQPPCTGGGARLWLHV